MHCSFRYKSVSEHSHLFLPPSLFDYEYEAGLHLWNLIKNSTLCCCVSKFYCSKSTNLDKCIEGCCGKCLIDEKESSSSESYTDSAASGEEETEYDLSEFEITDKSSTDYSSQSEDYAFLSS